MMTVVVLVVQECEKGFLLGKVIHFAGPVQNNFSDVNFPLLKKANSQSNFIGSQCKSVLDAHT